jgi:hypothetical protein
MAYDFPDLPDYLRIDQATRKAAWKGHKLTKQGSFFKDKPKEEDPATRKLRREIEAQEAAKKEERFARLKELSATKKAEKEQLRTRMRK